MSHDQSEHLLYADEIFAIQGAIFEVNRHMGSGFLEAVYQECLAIEFAARNVPFAASTPLRLTYKDHALRRSRGSGLKSFWITDLAAGVCVLRRVTVFGRARLRYGPPNETAPRTH
jgi:hypothetical protein